MPSDGAGCDRAGAPGMPQTARAHTPTHLARRQGNTHTGTAPIPAPQPRHAGRQTDRPGASRRPRQHPHQRSPDTCFPNPGLHADKERQSGRAVRALERANGSPTGPQPKSSSTAVRAVPPQHHRCQPSRPCSRANCASVAWDAITASSIVLRVQTQMRCKLREVHAGGYGGDRKPPSATFPRFRHQRHSRGVRGHRHAVDARRPPEKGCAHLLPAAGAARRVPQHYFKRKHHATTTAERPRGDPGNATRR